MSDELRPGAPIDVLQTWTDPPEWWPACVRKTAELAEGGSLRPLLAGEAFGPAGGTSVFAVYIDDEGKSWRRRAGTLPFTLATDSGIEIGMGRPTGDREADDRLAAVADELGCDPGAAIFHARAAVHDRDRWAGIVKKRELQLERLRAILDHKIDPVLLENDKLRSRCGDQHEALMDIAWEVSQVMEPTEEHHDRAWETPAPHQVVEEVRAALEVLKKIRSSSAAIFASAAAVLGTSVRSLSIDLDVEDENQYAGARAIARERAEQDWSDEHDDEHDRGELAIVAAMLACSGTEADVRAPSDLWEGLDPAGPQDPWGLAAKHVERRTRLVIAGALIAAEIDRLDRQESDRAE